MLDKSKTNNNWQFFCTKLNSKGDWKVRVKPSVDNFRYADPKNLRPMFRYLIKSAKANKSIGNTLDPLDF